MHTASGNTGIFFIHFMKYPAIIPLFLPCHLGVWYQRSRCSALAGIWVCCWGHPAPVSPKPPQFLGSQQTSVSSAHHRHCPTTVLLPKTFRWGRRCFGCFIASLRASPRKHLAELGGFDLCCSMGHLLSVFVLRLLSNCIWCARTMYLSALPWVPALNNKLLKQEMEENEFPILCRPLSLQPTVYFVSTAKLFMH